MYNQRKNEDQDESFNFDSNFLEEVNMTEGNKLIFEEERETELLKEMEKYRIVNAAYFQLEAEMLNKQNKQSGVIEMTTSNEYNSNYNSNQMRTSKKYSMSRQRESNSRLQDARKTINSENFESKRIIKIEDKKRKFSNFENDNNDW